MSTTTLRHFSIGKRTLKEISQHLKRWLVVAVMTPVVATRDTKRPRRVIANKGKCPPNV